MYQVWTSAEEDGSSYFSNAGALGDALAEYWDAGGAVVVASTADSWSRLGGRFADANQGYVLLDGSQASSFRQYNRNVKAGVDETGFEILHDAS